MRRMITETDVEKLDSIQPSEIEKLGKITNADIESVKAMQSPKNAKAGYVLTAVSGGTAEYKPAAGGTKLERPWTSGSQFYASDLKTNSKFPGYKVYEDTYFSTTKVICWAMHSFPYYQNAAGETVYIKPVDYFKEQSDGGGIVFGITDAAYDKFVADTAGVSNAFINAGHVYRTSYDQ